MTPHFDITRFYLLTAVSYLTAFNYCRGDALKCDFGKKELNCRFEVGALRVARQPNGVAVYGTGRKLDGRGFNSRCDHIEDPLEKLSG